MRLAPVTSGQILLNGEDIVPLQGNALRARRSQLQIIFQDPYSSLNPRVRAGDIVRSPLDQLGVGDAASRDARVAELFELVGLRPEQRALFPHQFSGGQRQRIGVARALATQPELIVCDEPVSALDVAIQAQILNLLRRLQDEFGLTYLFISHDLGVVQYMCDDIAVMYLGEIVEHADLSSLASWHINDMVVDTTGRAYVGNFGFDLHGPPPWDVAPAEIVIVEPDGAARIGDDDVLFPNGSVITPDGATLIVGQTFGNELLAWDIDPETGDLSNRRQWADLGERRPDGICLDANGAIWIAEPVTGGCFLIAEGGEVIDTIETDDKAFACMLGGPERRHLFVLTSAEDDPAKTVAAASGKISVVEVEVPGAGWP